MHIGIFRQRWSLILKFFFLASILKGCPNGICISFFYNLTLNAHRVGDIQFLGLIWKMLFDDGNFYEVKDEKCSPKKF